MLMFSMVAQSQCNIYGLHSHMYIQYMPSELKLQETWNCKEDPHSACTMDLSAKWFC